MTACGRFCCKSLFALVIKISFGCTRDFCVNMWGTSLPEDKLGTPDHRFAGANNAWLVFRSLDSYRPRFLTCDLGAGLTLAAIAIPEQMATARLGGFSPEIGF